MEKRKESRNWVEWTVTIISTIIVAFVIGILIYQVVVVKETPPSIHISLGNVEAQNDYFSIPVTVKNSGTVTAQNLHIEFITEEGINSEKPFLKFDYLPGKSEVKGWINFSINPDGKDIKSRILGFTVP